MTLSMMHKDHSLKLPPHPKAASAHQLVRRNYSNALVLILGGGVGGKEAVCSAVQATTEAGGGGLVDRSPASPTMDATAQRTNGPREKRCLRWKPVSGEKGKGKTLRVRRLKKRKKH